MKRRVKVLRSLLLVIGLILFTSCGFFFGDDDDDDDVSIDSLALGKTTLTMKVGSMDYLSVKVSPQKVQKDVKLKWNYDNKIISCDMDSNFGVTIKALSEGQTSLRCSYGGYDATCIITVTGYTEGYEEVIEPYIYSNTTIIQTSPGISEKVFVSLYGGDASDIDGYTWTNENNSVATIQPTGQYCIISAKDTGYTRLKITHNKASYPYYIGVYVLGDNTKIPYITTSTNILTMNRDDPEQTINCSLLNGYESSQDSNFRWELIKEENSEIPIKMNYNSSNAVISPIAEGSCILRITHPDAPYPLDILCRVITIVKNVYIYPDRTILYLNGDVEETVTSKLMNISESEYSIDQYEYEIDNESAAEIVASASNQVILKGKANGSCKVIISHPKAVYTREILCIVSGQLTDAIDASCYITTTQNYIRTKVGAEPITVNVALKGGEEGDESDFFWSVQNQSSDGISDVISIETTSGTIEPTTRSSDNYIFGTCHITPKSKGTAVITVRHPKVYYSTEILVKVLDANAILEEPLYFVGDGLVKILNGESYDYRVNLKGASKIESDDNNIKWKVDNPNITLVPSGASVNIAAPISGMGCTTSTMTVSHVKSENDKSVIIMTADDLKTLEEMKALYSDKNYYNLQVGDEANVQLSAAGFDIIDSEGNYIAYDFSMLNWTTSDPTVISLDRYPQNPLVCKIKALKSGQVTLTASIDNYSYKFKVTVYPEGSVMLDPEVYFTTTQNVINIPNVSREVNVKISAINLPVSEYSNISWKIQDDSIANVISNGENAIVTGLKEGETVILVNHPSSQNELKIYVRVGSEYVIPDTDPVIYISSQDVLTLLKDDQPQALQAVLVNYNEGDKNGFHFEVDDENVATISAQSVNGIAYVKPTKSGQCEITISHPATDIKKKVLVVVGNSAEELAAFSYLTTTTNVVAIGEGNTKNVSVFIKNAKDIIVDGYNWISSNPNVVDVRFTGANAVLTGNSTGTAIITVTNTACKYSLQIIAQCVDPIAAADNPFIQLTSSVLTLPVSSSYTNITADLVGGSASDLADFTWTTNDSTICMVYGQNDVGKLRALKVGTTYITVSHPKASYPAQILVVCDEPVKSDCYISVPTSILNLKPTDSAQTLQCTLVNGDVNDKYNFKWSQDVYDIIDLQYSANVCTITPKTTGSVTVTISHPKAAYDQQIIVNVQQYTSFKFPQDSITITQGDVKFINMQVPTTTSTTHVEYSVENSSICSVTGTKSVAQLTAVGTGTTTVKARLVATSTGVEQASSEMMVYVKEKDISTVYITSSTTISTVNKGKSQTLSATLTGTGVTTSDQQNLKWTTSDSDIVQVTGVNSSGYVQGQSIYVTALKPGEAIITCTHEKAASSLQFYVIVPGIAEKVVTFNKSYMTIIKGSSGSQLKATIENLDNKSDYNNLMWTCHDENNCHDVARVMGSGQTVTIYPVNVGECTVMAQLPDSSSVAKCTVVVEAGKSFTFEQSGITVSPFESKKVKYTVSPANAIRTWTMIQDNDYFEYRDLGVNNSTGEGYIEIIGLKEGVGTVHCVTNDSAKGSLQIKVSWNYNFAVSGATTFKVSPFTKQTLNYKVNPPFAEINLESPDEESFSYSIYSNKDGTGSIDIKPTMEMANPIKIFLTAINQNNGGDVIGTKLINASFQYPEDLHVKVNVQEKFGNFSRFENGALYIGDGESVILGLSFEEESSAGKFTSVTFNSNAGNTSDVNAVYNVDLVKNNTFIVQSPNDITKWVYKIISATAPCYDGVLIQNWKTELQWVFRNHSTDDVLGLKPKWVPLGSPYSIWPAFDLGWLYAADDEDDHTARFNPRVSRIELPEEVGKIYTDEEFHKIFWWWCVGSYETGKDDYLINPEDIDARRGVSTRWDDGTYDPYDETYEGFNLGRPGVSSRPTKLDPGVMEANVTVDHFSSTDKTVKQFVSAGNVTITYDHLGKKKNYSFPVYYEQRDCSKWR